MLRNDPYVMIVVVGFRDDSMPELNKLLDFIDPTPRKIELRAQPAMPVATSRVVFRCKEAIARPPFALRDLGSGVNLHSTALSPKPLATVLIDAGMSAGSM
jgi:hypothetical protein